MVDAKTWPDSFCGVPSDFDRPMHRPLLGAVQLQAVDTHGRVAKVYASPDTPGTVESRANWRSLPWSSLQLWLSRMVGPPTSRGGWQVHLFAEVIWSREQDDRRLHRCPPAREDIWMGESPVLSRLSSAFHGKGGARVDHKSPKSAVSVDIFLDE